MQALPGPSIQQTVGSAAKDQFRDQRSGIGTPIDRQVQARGMGPVNPEVASMATNAAKKRYQQVVEKFHGHLYASGTLDVQTGRLWDCLTFDAGNQFGHTEGYTEAFFSNVERSSGKSVLETNLCMNCRLPAPEAFAIERIVFTFSKSSDPADVAMCWDETWWELMLGKKRYVWSPMAHMQVIKEPLSPIRVCDFCKSVYANAGQCPGCGANSFCISTLGEMDSGQQFAMEVNPTIPILNQMSFHVLLKSSRPLMFRSAIKIWCHFEGLHALGIQ
jgi:hypothetical protein